MKIGLIDVDSHHFPNLALMRISAWHKAQGDDVEWVTDGFTHYDRVYKSKVFSDDYSPDFNDAINADEIIQGGTGYCIHLVDGKEVFDKSLNTVLPDEIEHMFPDYSIYPQYDYAVSMTSRGCPRGCPFCIVASKEGRKTVKVADVTDFWDGQKKIQVLDPNITACPQKHELFQQYIDTNAHIMFNQGLDIRLLTETDIEDLNRMKLEGLHFAWDNPNEDLTPKFKAFAEQFNRKLKNLTQVFCLVNYNSALEQDLYRIYTLKDLGYNPYVMIYDKPHCDKIYRKLQRWTNNKFIFRACDRFEDYIANTKGGTDDG